MWVPDTRYHIANIHKRPHNNIAMIVRDMGWPTALLKSSCFWTPHSTCLWWEFHSQNFHIAMEDSMTKWIHKIPCTTTCRRRSCYSPRSVWYQCVAWNHEIFLRGTKCPFRLGYDWVFCYTPGSQLLHGSSHVNFLAFDQKMWIECNKAKWQFITMWFVGHHYCALFIACQRSTIH